MLKVFSTAPILGLTAGVGVKSPISDKLEFFIESDLQEGSSNIINSDQGMSDQNSRSS